MDLVARGFGQAIACGRTGIGVSGDSQGRLGDDPSIAGAMRHPQGRLLGVILRNYLRGGLFVLAQVMIMWEAVSISNSGMERAFLNLA